MKASSSDNTSIRGGSIDRPPPPQSRVSSTSPQARTKTSTLDMNMNHLGTRHAAVAAGFHHQQPWNPQGGAYGQPIKAPVLRDVINGRGAGVQLHPGNVKYRKLVFVNKSIYAKCHKSDEAKISKGIVAAVRELGGRFLELDKCSGNYNDIGDIKAINKTSQALREGQTKIRQEIYANEARMGMPDTEQQEMSAEGYFGYSVQVLQDLYYSDECVLNLPHPTPTTVQPPLAKSRIIAEGFPSKEALVTDVNSVFVAALDQFPGAAPPRGPVMEAAQKQQQQKSHESGLHPSKGRFVNDLGRPSLSLGDQSMMPLSQPREWAWSSNDWDDWTILGAGGMGRGDSISIQPVSSVELRDLICISQHQLMDSDEVGSEGRKSSPLHTDEEVMIFNNGKDDVMDVDRVSELRSTDFSSAKGATGEASGVINNFRWTDTDEATDYCRTSLMEGSILTIGPDDMSVHTYQNDKSLKTKMEAADFLLMLQADHGEMASI